MTPEEERERFEELVVAASSFAMHLEGNTKDAEAFAKLSGYAQSLFHGVVITAEEFVKGPPPPWVRAAAERLSARHRESVDTMVGDMLSKRKEPS